METMRLRNIQQPKGVDRLLELFVTGTNRVPEKAYPVCARSALSNALKDRVQQAQHKHRAWSAWTNDHLTWLFTAEMSLALSRERGTPVLDILAYSDDGQLQEAGFWAQDKQGHWQRCAD
jgi:hypothetical protein